MAPGENEFDTPVLYGRENSVKSEHGLGREMTEMESYGIRRKSGERPGALRTKRLARLTYKVRVGS